MKTAEDYRTPEVWTQLDALPEDARLAFLDKRYPELGIHVDVVLAYYAAWRSEDEHFLAACAATIPGAVE